jgi:hypothetical protein
MPHKVKASKRGLDRQLQAPDCAITALSRDRLVLGADQAGPF